MKKTVKLKASVPVPLFAVVGTWAMLGFTATAAHMLLRNAEQISDMAKSNRQFVQQLKQQKRA